MNKYIEIEVKDSPKVFKIKFEKLEIHQHRNIFEITLAHTDGGFFSKQKIFCDCKISFFSNTQEVFSIQMPLCNVSGVNQDTLVIEVDSECTSPPIHLNIFDWIEKRGTLTRHNRVWEHFTEQNKFNWLRLGYYFQIKNPKISSDICYIDGSKFTTKMGFLCEIGEGLFGVGGYAGSDLDGLYDTLTGGINDIACIKQDIHVIWHNFSYSKNHMDNFLLTEIVNLLKSVNRLELIFE